MIPAKNRDRKCITCRHYQPSPLWRKGWCRNPLLYDRNTNHLVEADSLACNRTFIDYWEPITGPQQAMGPQARSNKPRIAPSIPMDATDPKGRRSVITGNTPAGGMAAVAPKYDSRQPQGRENPQLSLVTPEFEPYTPEIEELDPKATQRIEEIRGPQYGDGGAAAPSPPMSTAERIRAARNQARSAWLRSPRIGIILLLVLVGGIALIAGAMVLAKPTSKGNIAAGQPSATVPLPTPTGFGDATATPPPAPTQPVPPPGVIGVNGWVEVSVSKLNVRANPGATGSPLAVLSQGTKAHVIDGPQDAGGLTWWKVDKFDPKDQAKSGWCASKFLKPSSSP